MAALRRRCGHYIFALWFLLSIFFFSSPNLSRRRLDVYHTSTQWCGLTANLGCRSETCCTRLAENTGRKKSPSLHHRTTLFGYIISSQLRHLSTIGKNMLKGNNFATCPQNMANCGPLAAEICWRVFVQISTGFASWQRYCTAVY